MDVVKELIQNDSKIVNTTIDGDGHLPIHFAVEHSACHWSSFLYFFIKLSFEFLFPDKRKMVKILIDARPDTIDVKNVNGTTPLILACDKGMTMLMK